LDVIRTRAAEATAAASELDASVETLSTDVTGAVLPRPLRGVEIRASVGRLAAETTNGGRQRSYLSCDFPPGSPNATASAAR